MSDLRVYLLLGRFGKGEPESIFESIVDDEEAAKRAFERAARAASLSPEGSRDFVFVPTRLVLHVIHNAETVMSNE